MLRLRGKWNLLGSGRGRCRRPVDVVVSMIGYAVLPAGYLEAMAYRDGAPGEAVDCEACSYADPTVSAVWMYIVSSCMLLGGVIGW
jgi:hypothetical protein